MKSVVLPALLLLSTLGCGKEPTYEDQKASAISQCKAGAYETAIELLEALSKRDKRDFEVRYYLARSLEAVGQVKEALREWNGVLAMRPSFAEGYYRKGNCLVTLRQVEKAIEAWAAATRIDPTYTQAYYNQGRGYEDLEKWDDALQMYLQAIEVDSTFVEAHLGVGLLLKRAEEWEHALPRFETALRIDPQNDFTYLLRIECLRRLERFAEAVAAVDEFLEARNPEPPLLDSLKALAARLQSR